MAARFDLALMAPPAATAAVDAALLARVRAWCEQGVLTRPTRSFAAASIAPHPALDGVACALDGSHRLARLGRVRGLAWRLQVLLNDHRPGRPVQPGDPWDCGWWRDGAFEAAAAFRPRRPTLLLVRDGDAVAKLLTVLRERSAQHTRPLRVLVASTKPRPEAPPL